MGSVKTLKTGLCFSPFPMINVPFPKYQKQVNHLHLFSCEINVMYWQEACICIKAVVKELHYSPAGMRSTRIDTKYMFNVLPENELSLIFNLNLLSVFH